MSTVTNPQALVLNTQTQIAYPASGQFAAVVISNLSGYLLEVVVGSDLYWLSPWTAQVYPIGPGGQQPVKITPNLLAGTTAPTGVSSSLTATWFAGGEPISGTYPISLAANAIAATITGAVTAAISGIVNTANPVSVIDDHTFTPGVLPFTWSRTVAVPANCNAIDVYIGAGGLPTAITVAGVSSGFIYGYQGVLTTSGISYVRVPVNPITDPTITIGGTKSLGSLTPFRVVTVARTDIGAVAAFGALSQASDAAVPSTPLIPDDATTAQANFNVVGTQILADVDTGLPCDGSVPYRVYAITTTNLRSVGFDPVVDRTLVHLQTVSGGALNDLFVVPPNQTQTIAFAGGILCHGQLDQQIQGAHLGLSVTMAVVRFNS